MIRKNKIQHTPLYREVIRESLVTAWKKRSLWIFAIFAAILQTGGILDVLLHSVQQLTMEGRQLISSPWINIFSSFNLIEGTRDLHQVFSIIGRTQAFAYVSLIIGGILTCSILAQGALVYGLQGGNSKIPKLRECLAVSGKHSWSVATLNILSIGLLWLLRFLLLIPLVQSAQNPSVSSLIVYMMMFLVFIIASFLLTTVHLFTLNGLLLDELTLWQSLEQSYELFKKSWLIIVETGALMLVIGFGMMMGAFLLFLIGVIPLILFLLGAALIQSTTFMIFFYGLSSLLLFFIMIVCGTYMVTFQYDAWGRLYQRIRAGNAFSKMHRWYHWLKQSDRLTNR